MTTACCTAATRRVSKAFFSCKAALEVRRLRATFDEVWDRSEPDPDVRRLHL